VLIVFDPFKSGLFNNASGSILNFYLINESFQYPQRYGIVSENAIDKTEY
jgi:hypothetical protein